MSGASEIGASAPTLASGVEPTVDSYNTADVNVAADTADQQIIIAPGVGKQIWIYSLAGTANVSGSVSVQDSDDAALTGIMPVAAFGGLGLPASGNFAMPLMKAATNKAVEVDTVTCAFDGVVGYAIVSV